MMAIVVYRCVFGSHAYFDFDNSDGGLLKSCSSLTLYDEYIVPLVKFLCHFYNAVDHRGGVLLRDDDVLNVNIGNWFKNTFKRASDNGIYSDAGALAVIADAEAGNHADETACKGLYIHWYKWVAQNFPNFHPQVMMKVPTHVLSNAENNGAAWTAITSDNTYRFD